MQDYKMDTFIEVCKYMNYTKAAESLHMAQPTVSLHIRLLEEYYDTKLFSFHGKKMELTNEGKAILELAITQKNDNLYLQKKIKMKQNAPIRLGATLSVAESMLCVPLAHFLKCHESDFIQIDIDNTTSLLKKINEGQLDVAFIEGSFSKNEFDAVFYSKEKFTAVANPKIIPKNIKQLSDLFTMPLLIRENGSGTRSILEHYLKKQKYSVNDFQRKIEIGSVHLIKEALIQGCGMSFIYEATITEELETGTLVKLPIENASFTHDIHFLWRKNSIYKEEYLKILNDFK